MSAPSRKKKGLRSRRHALRCKWEGYIPIPLTGFCRRGAVLGVYARKGGSGLAAEKGEGSSAMRT